jgi:DnaK suppressor protein
MPDPEETCMSGNDEGLSAVQIQELHAEIEREIRRLERGMSGAREATRAVELDQTAVGRLSRIDALQNQQMAAGLRGREMARYAQLLEALERIDKGTYGRCQRCGRTIPFGRLLVMPEARACSSCGGG